MKPIMISTADIKMRSLKAGCGKSIAEQTSQLLIIMAVEWLLKIVEQFP